jgi:rubrerythrin
MIELKDSKTLENLKFAFAGESQVNRCYNYFAKQADLEGHSEASEVFKSTAEGETGHAFALLEFMEQAGDPISGKPIGDTKKNLLAAIESELYEYASMYPGFAKIARDEGFDEIAEWFETLARAEISHTGRFRKVLGML